MNALDVVPKDPDEIPKDRKGRVAWLKYRLSLNDYTIKKLADENDVTRQAMSAALSKPTMKLRSAIEHAVKMPASKIWPEQVPSFMDTYKPEEGS
ncbi:helix-turn-helix domain-containing protein [Pseudovibrio ascidiaceicola]|uniref:helix-turn-helix domain-containing protein n=1 Tax=Pseudovibrio ascidiaceicola TaxID=285279 RepID=UPI0006CF4775